MSAHTAFRCRTRLAFAALCGVLALVSDDARGVTRRGSELAVNSYTSTGQLRSSVGLAADGDFVVVWTSSGQDGDDLGVFARRFSSAGAPLGVDLQVNTVTLLTQSRPSVAVEPDGDFVVAWDSNQLEFLSADIFARRFASAGNAIGSEFRVNASTVGTHREAAVAADADGDFVVAWQTEDASELGVFARRFSSAGGALAVELQINLYTTGTQSDPSVALDADGDFVVAWHSEAQDGQSYGVFARRFASTGAPVASEFQVNTRTQLYQGRPTAGSDSDGDFVIAWSSSVQDGFSGGIFSRRFAKEGNALAVELQVNGFTVNSQTAPALAMDGDGDVLIAWSSDLQDGSLEGIFARAFSSAGSPLTGELQVNTYTTGEQYLPAVGADADGGFVVVWQSTGQDGSLEGVFAQRFGDAPLDVDGDGVVEAESDGVLVLRYLFGFRDAVLIAGVDLGGCARCTADEIEAHIAALLSQLDIDADGEVEPLNDGMLALRYLFDFRDAALTAGAVDTDCTRCAADDIEGYIQGLIG